MTQHCPLATLLALTQAPQTPCPLPPLYPYILAPASPSLLTLCPQTPPLHVPPSTHASLWVRPLTSTPNLSPLLYLSSSTSDSPCSLSTKPVPSPSSPAPSVLWSCHPPLCQLSSISASAVPSRGINLCRCRACVVPLTGNPSSVSSL